MGTIFKHNITPEEINKLGRMIPGREIINKEEYEYAMSDDIKSADLYRLYSIRGEKKQAQYYYDRIKDNILKYLLKGNDEK